MAIDYDYYDYDYYEYEEYFDAEGNPVEPVAKRVKAPDCPPDLDVEPPPGACPETIVTIYEHPNAIYVVRRRLDGVVEVCRLDDRCFEVADIDEVFDLEDEGEIPPKLAERLAQLLAPPGVEYAVV